MKIEPVQKPVYIDLFAGCGGLSLGLHKAGWQGLFAIEKSPHAFKTLSHNLIDGLNHFNWPEWLEKKNHDINWVIKNHARELKELSGKIDLVAGGPPCQGFSTAGKRVETDSRNNLIDSYLEFINLVRPKVVFFENVKGFTQAFKKNRSRGKAYADYVREKFESELGYEIYGDLIDFSEFGIPQKRTRFILVGIRKDYSNNPKIVESFFKDLKTNSRGFLVSKGLSVKTNLKQAISDLLMSNGLSDCPDRNGFMAGIYTKPKSMYQRYMRKGKKGSIPNSHSFPRHKEKNY